MRTRSLVVLAAVFVAGMFVESWIDEATIGGLIMSSAVAQEAPPAPPAPPPELTTKQKIADELAALRDEVAAMNSEYAALEADADNITLEQARVARAAVVSVRANITDARTVKIPEIVKSNNAIVEAFKQGKGDAVTRLLEKLAQDLRELLPQ